MIGFSIGLFEEETPMLCRECGKETGYKALVLQMGEAKDGNITPIEGLCEDCAKKSSAPQSQSGQM